VSHCVTQKISQSLARIQTRTRSQRLCGFRLGLGVRDSVGFRLGLGVRDSSQDQVVPDVDGSEKVSKTTKQESF
jgi:hypothetical protein